MATAHPEVLAEEHAALREGCGLLDRSERGKLALSGPDAVDFLNGQVTNELADLAPGHGRYAAFLTHKGKMLGDLRIVSPAGGPDAGMLLLDTERVALQGLFDMIRRYRIGFSVEVHKRTLERGLLSLIGPSATAVAGVPELAGEEHANVVAELAGVTVLAIRTDVGVDVLCEAADSERVRTELLARGALAVSEEAAEALRIERGRPRYGVELDETVIPQEAGLNERAVSFTKGCYVGQETVARLHYRGKPNRHLRGLRLGGSAEAGSELTLEGRPVGRLGAVVRSPTDGWIALGLVRREVAPGSRLSVAGAGTIDAEVLELPFRDA